MQKKVKIGAAVSVVALCAIGLLSQSGNNSSSTNNGSTNTQAPKEYTMPSKTGLTKYDFMIDGYDSNLNPKKIRSYTYYYPSSFVELQTTSDQDSSFGQSSKDANKGAYTNWMYSDTISDFSSKTIVDKAYCDNMADSLKTVYVNATDGWSNVKLVSATLMTQQTSASAAARVICTIKISATNKASSVPVTIARTIFTMPGTSSAYRLTGFYKSDDAVGAELMDRAMNTLGLE